MCIRDRIKSDLGKVVYQRVDNILLSKKKGSRRFENTALTIIEQYNLDRDKYQFLSRRKGLCERLAKLLHGRETSKKGLFIAATVAESADGKDWKIRFDTLSEGGVAESKKNKKLPTVNEEYNVKLLVEDLISVIGRDKDNEKSFTEYARVYSETLIRKSISEYRDLAQSLRQSGKSVKNPGGLFNRILHENVHLHGVDWLYQCGAKCEYKRENRLL